MLTRNEIIERCLDNTYDINNLDQQGILWFGKHFFPKTIRNAYSEAHFKMSQLYFEQRASHRLRSMDRQAYMLIHREAAKSTIGTFLMPLYSIFLKGYSPVYKRMNLGWEGGDGINNYDIVEIPVLDEKFILIASETAGQSESFVMDIKSEIESNKLLMEIFGSKHPMDIEEDDFIGKRRQGGKWTRSAFITNDMTAVWGVGSGQRVRGRKINGSRPTMIIVDDMYSEENVKTEERREGLNRWFYNALKNSLDSEVGKILWLGTMVHPDIVYKDFVKDPLWWGLEVPIIGEEELAEALGTCEIDKDGRLRIPDEDTLQEMNDRFTTLSWKERYPIDYILKKYIEQIAKERPDYFYQEYMNKPMAPESETIDPDAFQRYKDLRFYKNENGEQHCSYTDKDQIVWSGPVLLKVGIDMASALHKKSDDTVISVAGFARFYPRIPGMDISGSLTKYPKGKVLPVLAWIEGGKYDIININGMSEAKKDVSSSLEAILKRFKVERVAIEANGQQEQSIRAIKGYLRETGVTTPIDAQYVNSEKSQRIKATLLPIFQKYKIMICVDTPKVTTLYQQLNMLTISDKDDYPDSLEKAFVNARIPDEAQMYNYIEDYKTERDDVMSALGSKAWYYL